MIYGGASCIADAIGIYNMRCLKGQYIWIGLKANLVRAVLVAVTLLIPGLSALAVVVWSAIILVLGEVLLLGMLVVAFRGNAQGQ